jgi:hypothetical protein
MDRLGRVGGGCGGLACAEIRTENRKIDGMLRDFDRENPRREPGSPSPARRLAGLRRRPMTSVFPLFGAVCATGLAFAGPAIADEPGFGGFFGVAAEYPPAHAPTCRTAS